MKAADDHALVAQAVTGDGSAYGELFALYEKRIFNYAYGILGNREDAADVTQDAFVRVFQAMPGKDASLNFSAYIYRTTHNLAMNAIKQRNRFAGPTALDLEHEPSLQADPEKATLLAEQQEQTWRAAAKLGETHRAVLALRELHDMSYQEIADVMEMPRATVGVTLSRARLKFKEAFRMTSIDIDKLSQECERMLPLLSAYIDGELRPAEQDEVDTHLEECAFCQLALEEMTEASKSYRALLPLLPPTGIAKGVHAGLADLLSPDEAYAMEQSLDSTAGEAPGTAQSLPSQAPATVVQAPPRQKASRARWVGRAAIVAVCTGVLVLAGTATVSEYLPPEDESARMAVVEEEVLPEQQDESAAEEPTQNEVPEEPVDDSNESGDGAIGTFVPADPADAPAGDTTPPRTPAPISPDDNQIFEEGDTVVLTWTPVEDPSGVTYGVNLERYDADAGEYVAWKTIPGLTEPTLTYRTGETAERWRVWATDGAENESEKTGYRTVLKPLKLIPGYEIYEPPTLY